MHKAKLDLIPDLAQKLYEQDGHSGNLYRTSGNQTHVYEGKVKTGNNKE